MVCDASKPCITMADFDTPENVLPFEKSITLKHDSSSKTVDITFAKCDGAISSSANDGECNSSAYFQQLHVAVFVVLNDFKGTNNFYSPFQFKFALGPRGCATNTITGLFAESPADSTYRIDKDTLKTEMFGFKAITTKDGCPSRA